MSKIILPFFKFCIFSFYFYEMRRVQFLARLTFEQLYYSYGKGRLRDFIRFWAWDLVFYYYHHQRTFVFSFCRNTIVCWSSRLRGSSFCRRNLHSQPFLKSGRRRGILGHTQRFACQTTEQWTPSSRQWISGRLNYRRLSVTFLPNILYIGND